ncbi:MAG TPA: two-component regulator propeller domain-containing protein, partial [Bacteroidia bacterium]|nr:two-component regulator propeller domain-containing protein [Bacteroidia bacterium]
ASKKLPYCKVKNGLKNAWVYKLLDDGNQTWIGTQNGVFIYREGKIYHFDRDSTLNNSSVWTMYIDQKKNIWFGTVQNGAVCYNPEAETFKHFTTKNGLTDDQVRSISEMDDGTLLIGTISGLNKINKQLYVSMANEIRSNENIAYWCILKENQNHFYLGTGAEGLLNVNFAPNSRQDFNSTNGLTNNMVLSLLKDREGNLWIGTANGVYKYYNDKFTYYFTTNGLLDNYVNKVSVDVLGNYWLSAGSGGLTKIAHGKVTNYNVVPASKNSLPDKNVNVILALENGNVYVGTDEGLCVFENGNFRTLSNAVFEKKYILSLFRDSKNKLWIGTSEGVYSIENNVIRNEEVINSFDMQGMQFAVFCISEDKNGALLFGLENGLLQYNGKKLNHIGADKNFTNARVCTAISDFRNNTWIGTAEGLYFYDGKRYQKISRTQGLNFGFINFLQPDQNKQLFIGTNDGVDILFLESFYQNKKIRIKHLGKEDGLLSRETIFNSSAIDHDGRILIGSANGLNIYDPHSDVFNKQEAKTSIASVKLFFGEEDISKFCNGVDSSSLLPNNLVLPHLMNNLSFRFIGISLIAPEKVMFTYKLEGLDKDWSPAQSHVEANYPSLPPGKYTFKVKAKNNDGLWNRVPATFSFEILAPWYTTRLFYLICAVLLVAGILFYNRTRTRMLKADKRKLEQTVHERTKELRNEKEKVEVINKEVMEQKTEIENKNSEITDSIKYAKNIQEALLPSLKETENAFRNCFIFYQPKDIVSGDFFWFSKNENTQFIAAADCTGHGVPGAFMSIIGNTLLNEIVEQQKIEKPGDILLELHKGVKKALNQNDAESERRDGMDIVLCAHSRHSNKIEYAGANRPLWIYRKDKDYELEIVKPTKSPIGGLEMEERRVYENVSIEVFEGDVLYFFSDGFADQFGGPKGKKFMISNMQKLLRENIELPMRTQKGKIKKAFDLWKGETEQVDDVLVIGIRVSSKTETDGEQDI